jgi:hypothetical protein
MSADSRNHKVHCACVVTLRHVAEALIDAIEQPAAESWTDVLDRAVADAKAKLSEVGGEGL